MNGDVGIMITIWLVYLKLRAGRTWTFWAVFASVVGIFGQKEKEKRCTTRHHPGHGDENTVRLIHILSQPFHALLCTEFSIMALFGHIFLKS